jgi:hypothetical protein
LWQARQNIAQLIPFLEKVKSQLPFFYEAEEFAVAVLSALKALPLIAEMSTGGPTLSAMREPRAHLC